MGRASCHSQTYDACATHMAKLCLHADGTNVREEDSFQKVVAFRKSDPCPSAGDKKRVTIPGKENISDLRNIA
jgi:hypothetical protein